MVGVQPAPEAIDAMGTRTGRWLLALVAVARTAMPGVACAQGRAALPPPLPERPGMLNPLNAGRPVGHWEGVLPDRRCGGVWTELDLATGLDGPDGSYSLSERCMSDPPGLPSRVGRGRWQTLRASSVFQLLDASPDGARNFALHPDGSLHELDAALDADGQAWRRRVLSRVP